MSRATHWRGVLAMCAFALAPTAFAADLAVRVTGATGKPLANAVVFLQSPAAEQALKPGATAEISQRDKTFIPEQIVITRGTAVNFPNRDTVRHHVYSFSPAKRFELKLYIGTPAEPVLFDQAGVAVLGCNIHDHMVSWVVVVDTPWHASTDGDGRAVVRGVPPGDYTLRTWHRNLPPGAVTPERPLNLPASGAEVVVQLEKARS